MKFWDLVDYKTGKHLGDIIKFDDDVVVLKFNMYGKVHYFDDFSELRHFLNRLRIPNYHIVKNGVQGDDENSDEE